MGVLQQLKTKPFFAVSWKTVERSKNVLAFLVKTEPRQLKSLGTDAFIAFGSLHTARWGSESNDIAIKVWGPVKKFVASKLFAATGKFSRTSLLSVCEWWSNNRIWDPGKSLIERSRDALLRTLFVSAKRRHQLLSVWTEQWVKQIKLRWWKLSRGFDLQRRVWSWLRMNAGGVLNTCKSNEPSG